MAFALYYHPFSSYSQKAVVAFYEKGVAFEAKILDGTEPVQSDFAVLWPIGKFPALTDGERLVFDATGIIEYLDALYPDLSRLIPQDPLQAAEVRMWDRFFDNYVSYPQQQLVNLALGREPDDGQGGARWKAALADAYALLDRRMADRQWVAADRPTLADCGAAPFLLYADWTHPIPKEHAHVWAYRSRLLSWPSYARALDEARPYRHLFPLGAPEGRD